MKRLKHNALWNLYVSFVYDRPFGDELDQLFEKCDDELEKDDSRLSYHAIRALSIENDDLKAKAKQLKNENTLLKNANFYGDNVVGDLKIALESAREEVERLQSFLNKCIKENTKLTDIQIDLQEQHDEDVVEIDELNTVIKEKDDKIASLKHVINRLTKEYDKMKKEKANDSTDSLRLGDIVKVASSDPRPDWYIYVSSGDDRIVLYKLSDCQFVYVPKDCKIEWVGCGVPIRPLF